MRERVTSDFQYGFPEVETLETTPRYDFPRWPLNVAPTWRYDFEATPVKIQDDSTRRVCLSFDSTYVITSYWFVIVTEPNVIFLEKSFETNLARERWSLTFSEVFMHLQLVRPKNSTNKNFVGNPKAETVKSISFFTSSKNAPQVS